MISTDDFTFLNDICVYFIIFNKYRVFIKLQTALKKISFPFFFYVYTVTQKRNKDQYAIQQKKNFSMIYILKRTFLILPWAYRVHPKKWLHRILQPLDSPYVILKKNRRLYRVWKLKYVKIRFSLCGRFPIFLRSSPVLQFFIYHP